MFLEYLNGVLQSMRCDHCGKHKGISSHDAGLAPDYHAPRGSCSSCKTRPTRDRSGEPYWCRTIKDFTPWCGEVQDCPSWEAKDGWKDTCFGAEPKEVLNTESVQKAKDDPEHPDYKALFERFSELLSEFTRMYEAFFDSPNWIGGMDKAEEPDRTVVWARFCELLAEYL